MLWTKHHRVAPYPPGVVAVPSLIAGTAFFPGGRGLWQEGARESLPPLVEGGFMVLGHDFHSEWGYRASLQRGAEPMTQPTWRGLNALLKRAAIHPEICFFTNFYMGLRAGTAATGVFPGAKDAAFRSRCLDFLREQLATARPRVVLTLGRFVPPLIAALAKGLAQWHGAPSLARIDGAGALRRDVIVPLRNGDLVTTFVALTHPSLRHLGVVRRRYVDRDGRPHLGEHAENAMLQEACETFPVY